jgi:hypothetical protein
VSNREQHPSTTSPRRKPRRSPGAQSQRTARRTRVASACDRDANSGRAVRIRAVRRDPPDLDRFVAALLALALTDEQTDAPGQDERS